MPSPGDVIVEVEPPPGDVIVGTADARGGGNGEELGTGEAPMDTFKL